MNNKITEYKVIEADSISELNEKVNDSIKKGFVPIGKMETFNKFMTYYQTMVVYEKNNF